MRIVFVEEHGAQGTDLCGRRVESVDDDASGGAVEPGIESCRQQNIVTSRALGSCFGRTLDHLVAEREHTRRCVGFVLPIGMTYEQCKSHVGQRVEVCAVVDRRIAGELLRGHEQRGAERTGGPEHRERAHVLGNAKVEDLEPGSPVVAVPEEHVVRLEIAMHDTLFVDSVEPKSDLLEECADLCDLEASSASQHRAEVFPLKQLHHDEARARGVQKAAIGHRYDVVATNTSRDHRLLLETLPQIIILRGIRKHGLERTVSVGLQIEHPIHTAHAAESEATYDTVPLCHHRAFCQEHRWRWVIEHGHARGGPLYTPTHGLARALG